MLEGMGRVRADLAAQLQNAEVARHYIATFKWPGNMRPEVMLVNGQEVHFKTMTDIEAIAIAQTLLQEITIPRALRERNLNHWEH